LSSNYTLLIQGPILSSGRTGITAFNQPITGEAIVNYNCEKNILKLLSDFGHLFKNISIITWENEEIKEALFEKNKNCTILKLSNNVPVLKIRNQNLPTDFNNKFKQFYALSKGLKQIEGTDESDYVIKLRTDQYVDLQGLISEHQRAIREDELNLQKIFVSFIGKINYSVSDFYFVATKKKLIDFVDSMLWGNYIEFNSSVHLDMSLKYTYLHHRHIIGIPTKTYFINSFDKNPNQDKAQLKKYLTENIYKPFSLDIYLKTVWRGDLISPTQALKDSLIFSDKDVDFFLKENKIRKSTIFDFLYINIPSYIFVKFPFVKNTIIGSFIKFGYQLLNKVFKK
jgi:hypothetical protein